VSSQTKLRLKSTAKNPLSGLTHKTKDFPIAQNRLTSNTLKINSKNALLLIKMEFHPVQLKQVSGTPKAPAQASLEEMDIVMTNHLFSFKLLV